MKIEKISDTQIRVTLNHSDLHNRNIKLSELAYGSQKAQDLFRDMMEKAYSDFGFDADNVPLMIEAVPMSTDCIMIVVTKVDDPTQIDEKFQSINSKPTHRTFKNKTAKKDSLPKVDDKAKPRTVSNICVYSFDTLDDVVSVSYRLHSIYCGENTLYKDEQGQYFLVLHPNYMESPTLKDLETLLSEFGQEHANFSLSERFLQEHGEVLIKNKAVEVLSSYL